MIMRTVLFCWPALFRNFFCSGMFLTNHVGLFAWNVFFMEWWRACNCSEISSQDWGRGGTGPNGSIVKVLPSLSWLVVRGSRVGDCETGHLPKRKCCHGALLQALCGTDTWFSWFIICLTLGANNPNEACHWLIPC